MTPTSPAGSAPGEDALRDDIARAIEAHEAFDVTRGTLVAGARAIADAVLAVIGADHATLLASKEAAEREAEEAKAIIAAAAGARWANSPFSEEKTLKVAVLSLGAAARASRPDEKGNAFVLEHLVRTLNLIESSDAATADLKTRIAGLEALMDASWKRVLAYRFSQVGKHLVAANMLSDMEAAGFAVPAWLADAVVNGDDETALSFDRAALSKDTPDA